MREARSLLVFEYPDRLFAILRIEIHSINPNIEFVVKRRLHRISVIVAIVIGCPLLFLAACQSKLIYLPRHYPPETVERWQASQRGEVVDFTTSQGQQRAFLQGNLESPRHLWIVCGGNATLVLEWSSWLARYGPTEDAWLLVDFPGYGDSEGKPNPENLRETFQTVIPLAAKKVGMTPTPAPDRLRVLGHSLGAAAVLIAASEFEIQSGVLLAPFTSTMDMSRVLVGVPLGFLVTHRFDNVARLDEMAQRGPASITLLHGTHDEVIPVGMSRTLADGRGNDVRLIEIEGAGHNDIAATHANILATAIRNTGSAGERIR